MPVDDVLLAGVETGGTKVVCGFARASAPERPFGVTRFPTTDPDETTGRIRAALAAAEEPIAALGVASFGPVGILPGPRFGWVTGTPKEGWVDTPLLDRIRPRGVPAAFLSDVAAAALAEQRHGAARGIDRVAYATVGTGIGVGLLADGRLLGGDGWPELGHILVRRHPGDDFAGVCPYHGDCLEGLASGPAVLARWGADGSSLGERTGEAVAVLGSYIGQLVSTVGLTIGVERMVMGGGVLRTPGLLDEVRRVVPGLLGGPGGGQAVPVEDPELIVQPEFDDAGLVGALTAAADLLA